MPYGNEPMPPTQLVPEAPVMQSDMEWLMTTAPETEKGKPDNTASQEVTMTAQQTELIIQQLKADKYLNAIQHLQDEILKLEVKSDPVNRPTDIYRKRIDRLTKVIEKIGEAAAFGDEWEEGRKAKLVAINRLQKMITR